MEQDKKKDGRANNGGHSTKGRAGRPPKITEKKLRTLSISAIRKEFGSEDKMWRMIAKKAKDGSFPHLVKLLEYNYGKPREHKEVEVKQSLNIPIASFLGDEDNTIDITPKTDSINE